MVQSAGTRSTGIALAGIVAVALLAQFASGQTSDPPSRPGKAAPLVRRALEAEAQGDADGRREYLSQALAVDPEDESAHWHLGDVRLGKRWAAAEQLSRDPVRIRKMDEYRALFAKAADTVYDQQKLAQFCGRAGFVEQEQFHFGRLLRLAPNSPSAMKKLGVVFVRGRYLTPEQVAAQDKQSRQWKATNEKWLPRLGALRQDAASNDASRRDAALAAVRKIHDLDAIPALEANVLVGTAEFGQAAIDSLAYIPQQQATDSLARHAAFAPHAAVRQAAIRELKPRSIYAYVPTLLAALQLPVDARFETFFLDDGRPGHRLTLFQEGATDSKSFVSEGAWTETIGIRINDPHWMRVRVGDPTVQEDTLLTGQAAAYNLAHEQINEHVAVVLQETVGQNLGADPKAWWEWWAMKNELYGPQEKPVSYMTRSYGAEPVQVVRYHSCFVPGTLVWTAGSPTPIEKIKVGEFVLSRNVDTGELAYKAVTGTTVGPKLPLVEINAGSESIRCTFGHLFWVCGTGWQMAKELKAGQWLHTLRGPLLIDNIEKKGEASCHNLIVDDFNTYFVTDSALLVHDINVRRPTTSIVPGLPEPATSPGLSR